MPEGDTIFRSARALHRALAGKTITSFESAYAKLVRLHDDALVTGRRIEKVEARGKWLLMYFSGDLILVTHMLMNGSWHLYRHGERWQKPRRHARVLLTTGDWQVVAFDVPVAEFYTANTLALHRMIPQLGPDLLKSEYTPQTGTARLAQYALAHPGDEIANVLLDQRVIAGIGNIFKSEVCFAAGVHPFREMRTLQQAEMEKIADIAHRYLKANVQEGSGGRDGVTIVTYTGMRRTTGSMQEEERLWVYGRRGRECRRCGEIIRMRKQGAGARYTYWCPLCQPFGAAVDGTVMDVEGWSQPPGRRKTSR